MIDGIGEMLKEAFKTTDYKKLWEEQNVELDREKLRIHRQMKEIKKLELRIENLEKEITDLKARRTSKKSK